MKKIDLEVIERKDHFTIRISTKKSLKFLNKTKADIFLRKYKILISENVAMLNLMQPVVNTFYRQNIFTLDWETERRVSSSLVGYDERFNFIFKSFSEGNKNAFVFSNINVCLSFLQQACEVMYNHAKRYKNHSLKAGLLPLIKNIKVIEKQIEFDKHNLFIDQEVKQEDVVFKLKKTS